VVVAAVLVIPAPAYADGGAEAGADAVSTILVVGALVSLAVWWRWGRPGAVVKLPRWVPLVVGGVLLAGALTAPTWVPKRQPSKGRPTTKARLAILSPIASSLVPSPVVVRMRLVGGRLVPETVLRNRSDEGHIHVSLDGRLVAMVSALDARLPEVAPGRHVVTAEFVAADHGPFRPPVVVSVTFDVASAGAGGQPPGK
jgi:hypothetical protein